MTDDIRKASTKKTIRELVAEAKDEINEEQMKVYKRQIKEKLALLTKAQWVVKNLERELEDLEIEISDKLS